MDRAIIKRKISASILKAIQFLSGGIPGKGISASRICTRVKSMMPRVVPVADRDRLIRRTLKDMSAAGEVTHQGNNCYSLGRGQWLPEFSPGPGILFPGTHIDPSSSTSGFDPTFQPLYDGGDSSEDESEPPRKRWRRGGGGILFPDVHVDPNRFDPTPKSMFDDGDSSADEEPKRKRWQRGRDDDFC